MICKSFADLDTKEKQQMLGKINHLIQSSEVHFGVAEVMIQAAESMGLLKGIDIMPMFNPLIENQEQELKKQIEDENK